MTVAIVGAGPGDPGLVTVRALELVRASEILVYDRLVSLDLVSQAVGATRIARESLSQEEVNDLLVHHGKQGRRVVRLKGGDPFIFGRGAEEVAALAAAGVEYEVVPGLSTLTAIPGLAGIPLTARGVAAQLTVLTGTSGDGRELDYERLAGTPGTLVIFMGLARLETIADNLILAGRSVDEPAAVISRLSLPGVERRIGTLGTIAGDARGLASPAVVVIGDVVAHASQLQTVIELARRRERLDLSGHRFRVEIAGFVVPEGLLGPALRDREADEDADGQGCRAGGEGEREPMGRGVPVRGQGPGEDRRCRGAAEGAADGPRDGVHAGRDPGLLRADVLDDQVCHRREREADPRAEQRGREVDLPAFARGRRRGS